MRLLVQLSTCTPSIDEVENQYILYFYIRTGTKERPIRDDSRGRRRRGRIGRRGGFRFTYRERTTRVFS
jgi:hypothetical protein